MISFGAAISGITASQTRMAVSANDVANFNTPNYRESRMTQSEGPTTPDGRGSGTRIAEIRKVGQPAPGFSSTDLATEVTEGMISERSQQANISVLKTQDRMMGDLLDIVA